MTYSLLCLVPVRLAVVEQHLEPSDGHRCSAGVLDDGPQQDLVRLEWILAQPDQGCLVHRLRGV